MNSVSCMNNLRNLMKRCVNLQENLMVSTNPVKEIANSKSESMSLKDQKTSVQKCENVTTFAKSIYLIDRTVDIT